MINKCTIQLVTNGYKMMIEFEGSEKYEFVESTMEGVLLILYKLQAEIRETSKKPAKKGLKK